MLNRDNAHAQLTDAAHVLRSTRPGLSLADAMELAVLRSPATARMLADDMASRAARGHAPEEGQAARRDDALSVEVRDYCHDGAGKIDPIKLRALADANGVWRDRYDALSLGSQVASVMARFRVLVERGGQVVFP